MILSRGRSTHASMGGRRVMSGVLLAMMAVLVAGPSVGKGLTLEGIVTHVRDGDTIEVSGVPIRLSGVTADELETARGKTAAAFMRDIVKGKTVTCALTGAVTHDRQVGRCSINGHDLGKTLIAARLAGRCARFDPEGYYRVPQQQAGAYVGLMPAYCTPR